jgi:transglutaminase-like putative cysteine protease
MTSWLDKDLLPVRSRTEIPGLGQVTFYRTTREAATSQGGAVAQVADLGLTTLVPVQKAIPRPHDTRSAVYRITIKGDDDAKTAFAQDDRQQVKAVEGNTIELQVRSIRGPQAERSAQAKPEFLESSYYINSDDARVKELARRAVGAETDPWRKALLIERWVHNNMQVNNSVAFGPADQVARDLRGDCRQHAMLTAAMCRAAGVPSRTALGLVYVMNDKQPRPVFGFHMWTEVWVNGQWLAIDAILGQGYVGAAHIKISDHSWYKTESLTPLLPVARVLGKLTIEVRGAE